MNAAIRPGLLLLCALVGSACSESQTRQTLRSLERSGAVSFVCLGVDAARDPGRALDACPDFDPLDERREVFALVTQTQRGEVAVVNLTAASVVDNDPWVPGESFLPVGENPVSIVSTPGGVVSFVASAGGTHHQGIYALPSSCINGPRTGGPRPDLALWPACALPAAPGEMVVLIDPPDEAGRLRETCGDAYVDPSALPVPLAAVGAEASASRACEADLRQETTPPGRRKLAVTLADVGELWILDAQRLLDVTPGTFPACADVALEQVVRLDPTVPDPMPPQDPGDLAGAESCLPPLDFGPAPQRYVSRPSGLEVRESVLYVGDVGAPLVHRYAVADPCSPTALPPLLPRSFEEPTRTVFARSLAVSPTTTKGERFVYAVDDQRGNLMVFDVTPGAEQRTPLVRSRMKYVPFEIPDRLQFGSPVKDVEFVFRDLPETDPATGIAVTGQLCDPDPLLQLRAPQSPLLGHRPDGTYDEGARPFRLRGTFAFALLANGTVTTIDVEDLDAPCRRPILANPDPVSEDVQGCLGDLDPPGGVYTLDGTLDGEPTVTGELSCQVVVPHRPRSAKPFASSAAAGVSAAALRTHPQLRSPTGGSLPSNQSELGLDNPKLLAVDFPDGTPAQVYLGTTLLRSDDPERLAETDPTVAERNAVGFIYREPRAFLATDEIAVVYEGAVMPLRTGGILRIPAEGATAELDDAGGVFCSNGVEDLDLARALAEEQRVPTAEQERFALRHADYVQIVSPIPERDDPYWGSLATGCGGGDVALSRYTCEDAFGTPEEPQESRDLVVVEAYQGRLTVTPRTGAGADPRAQLELIDCCFGGEALAYRVRAGGRWFVSSVGLGAQHRITARSDDLRCVSDCNPRRELTRSRVLEIATMGQVDPGPSAGIEACGPGECLACLLEEAGPVAPDSPCVFENATMRFAIYRGRRRSERDMTFGWQYAGGFVPMTTSLSATSLGMAPLSLKFLSPLQELAVTDGAEQGLVFISLDTVTVHTSFY